MKVKSSIIIPLLLISISFGYIDHIIPYYIKFFGNKILILNDLSTFEKKCNKRTDTSICTERYQIPIKLVKFEYLGTGFFSSATKYYCQDKPNNYVEIDNILNPERIFDIVNTYQKINIKSLECKEFLIIESWSSPEKIRTGHQKGKLISANYSEISRIEKISTFFSTYIFLIISMGLIFILLITIQLNIQLKRNYIIVSSILWILYLFFATGYAQSFFPYIQMKSLSSHLVWITSYLAHISLAFFTLETSRIRKNIIVFVIPSIIISLYFYNFWYLSVFLIFCIYGFIIIKKKDIRFIAFFISTFLTYLKLVNVNHMPSQRTTTYTFFIIICYEFYLILKQINIQSIVNEKFRNTLLQQRDAGVKNHHNVNKLIHDLQSPLTVLQFSLENQNDLIKDSLLRMTNILNKNNQFESDPNFYLTKNEIESLINEKNFIHNSNIDINFNNFLTFSTSSYILRILSNLIDNSIEAANDKYKISFSLRVLNNKLNIEINNFTNINSDILSKLNTGQFFTTKASGQGIGASSAFDWILKLKGSIQYYPEGKVILILPCK